MNMISLAAVAFGLLALTSPVLSDTPANCTWEEVHGTWQIMESTRFGGTNQIDCSNSSIQFPHHFQFTLKYPDLVIDSVGNFGFWTLIYNQGIEVRINGRKYFGFFPWKQQNKTVLSYCDRLQNVSSTSHDLLSKNWACFRAQKKAALGPKVDLVQQLDDHRLHKTLFRNNQEFIDKINSVQSLWTAGRYEEYEGVPLIHMLRRRGGRRSRVPQRPRTVKMTSQSELLLKSLPESWDWRNVNGLGFVSPVRNQGACGSCYSFSSLGMIEARLQILTNNTDKYTLSEQDVVECCKYSQGCDGGFPYLVAGKYAEDYGLALESCNPYSGAKGQCKTKPGCFRVGATDYQYVGGYYGACNEAQMQIALVNNGPISVSFEVYPDFQQYKGGIYRHTGLEDKFNPFELTNHAVLLVGYGVDKPTGTKYWIVKNSWGANWGEKGYFRIVKGVDEVAIESMALESFPMLP